MSILIGLLLGAAIGGALGRVLPIVKLQPKYAPGDKVWHTSSCSVHRGVITDISNGAYYVKRGAWGDVVRVTFREGVKQLALRDEETT